MINISTLFDPRHVFLIYAPILFALNRRVGHRLVVALTWTEWANQVLKWLLAGERPYWYVHERANELARRQNLTAAAGLYGPGALESPIQSLTGRLKQFPVTCELGAGSPSGHAMVTATVWYILIDALLKGELRPLARARSGAGGARAAGPSSRAAAGKAAPLDGLSKAFWAVYALMLLLVSLSRVYLACHFPHQCLAGALLGCLLARLVADKLPMERLSRGHFVAAALWMFGSAMATYGALRWTGFDPLWSVDKAVRWCVDSAYIHQDTAPFFSMVRYLGFCLGAGLAFDGAKAAAPAVRPAGGGDGGGVPLLALRRLLVAALAVALGQLLAGLPLPRANQQLFYASSFLVHALFAYAIAGPIPGLVKAVLAGRAPRPKRQ